MKKFRTGLYISILFLIVFVWVSCNQNPPPSKEKKIEAEAAPFKKVSPEFNGDSAYYFVSKQVEFGPRVNNTSAHVKCGDWMVKVLKSYGAEVYEQKTIIPFQDDKLNARNIIASFNPKAKHRVLLCAHWDSRPWGDKDDKDTDKPIDGANDGASGVGVLLEVARILNAQPTMVGVDIILFDAEDRGLNNLENSWCLGSEYWATNLHTPNYKADFGILLDMVGAANATFAWESYSTQFARPVLEKVWNTARQLGYDKHFIYYQSGAIEDDHYHIINHTGIPVIDIIAYDPTTTSSFPEHHHTHRDNMKVIDRNTLKAVGQTILETVYAYQP